MRDEIRRLQRKIGITSIYVTHDQEEALTMSDRIAVMHQGKVLQVGTPTEVYERPSCRFVADFIGESNFLEGVVQEQQNGQATVLVDGTLPVVAETERVLTVGTTVTLAIRPEKIQLQPRPPHSDVNSFPCSVEQVVYVGTDTRFLVRLSDNARLAIRQQNVVSVPDPTGYSGEPDTPAYAVWLKDAGRVLMD
jgi:spermidine/putrescine transport system ATP-binding protein